MDLETLETVDHPFNVEILNVLVKGLSVSRLVFELFVFEFKGVYLLPFVELQSVSLQLLFSVSDLDLEIVSLLLCVQHNSINSSPF